MLVNFIFIQVIHARVLIYYVSLILLLQEFKLEEKGRRDYI